MEITREHLELFLEADEIQAIVKRLSDTLSDRLDGESDTLFIGVLNGSFMFLADLVRRVDQPIRVGFVRARSYRGKSETPGRLEISLEGAPDLEDRDVLIVEDIVDTGKTVQAIRTRLREEAPERIRVCSLLQKPDRTQETVSIDFLGHEVPDRFVVGYGLDYDGKFRHLPHLAFLPEDTKVG